MRCLFILAGVCGLCLSASAETIAFFYALEADLRAFLGVRPVIRSFTIGKRVIYEARIGRHRVVCAKMGVGSVDAALFAQGLLTRVPCSFALSVGVAGSLSEDLPVGQWLHVVGVSDRELVRKFALARAEDFGGVPFRASLLQVKAVSVEKFVSGGSVREILRNSTGAGIVEMNLLGLAAACEENGVPLFAVRVVSDLADGQAIEGFRQFVRTYDGLGGALAADFVAKSKGSATLEDFPNLERLFKIGPR